MFTNTVESGNTLGESRQSGKISKKVADILGKKFQNPNIPMNKSTLRNIRILEITSLYDFLIQGNIDQSIGFQRPKCPISSSRDYSFARYEYKKAMVDYISSFGYQLRSHPCHYPLTFIETLANYCEFQSKK